MTLQGTKMASRVGASLVKAAGVPELVTDSMAGYARLVEDLARWGAWCYSCVTFFSRATLPSHYCRYSTPSHSCFFIHAAWRLLCNSWVCQLYRGDSFDSPYLLIVSGTSSLALHSGTSLKTVGSYFARNDWWFGDLLRRNNCMLRRVST